jgi:hypothetical protein
MPKLTIQERLERRRRIDKNGCWVWTGKLHVPQGYGVIVITTDGKPKERSVHVVSYETYVGPVPAGLELDHVCRNRACFNPAIEHLEPVTHAENVRRGLQGRLRVPVTHCPQGHEYSSKNTHVDKHGYRHCLTCNREHCRRYYASKKAAA